MDGKGSIRFLSKVQKHKNCCWIWTASKNKSGYGQFWFKGKAWLAHRVAYFITYRDPRSLCVLHKCDNPQCVRPDHLFLGTDNDNVQDSIKKGRNCGPPSHFTPTQIRSIRKLYQQGYSQKKIAKKFEVSQQTISYIVNRKLFKYVI